MGKKKKTAAIVLTSIPLAWDLYSLILLIANMIYVGNDPETEKMLPGAAYIVWFVTLGIVGPVMLILSILGLVFSIKAQKQGANAVWLIVLSAITLVVSVFFTVMGLLIMFPSLMTAA